MTIPNEQVGFGWQWHKIHLEMEMDLPRVDMSLGFMLSTKESPESVLKQGNDIQFMFQEDHSFVYKESRL